MEFDNYLTLYDEFNAAHFPQATVEQIEDKVLEEMRELAHEIVTEGTQADKIAESLDVFNLSVKLLTAYGVVNILDAAAQKLALTAVKYRQKAIDTAPDNR